MEWISVKDRLPCDLQFKECKSEVNRKRKLEIEQTNKITFSWLSVYRKGKWHPQPNQSPITHWRDSTDF